MLLWYKNWKYLPKKVLDLDNPYRVNDHAEACKQLGYLPSLFTINNGLIEFTLEHPFYVKERDGTKKWVVLVSDPNQHTQKGNMEYLRLKVNQELLINKKCVNIESIEVSREDIPDEPV